MKLKSFYILTGAALMLAFASCKKEDLAKINTDPNAVSVDVFDPNNMLSATQLYASGSASDAIEVEETEIQGAGCYIQHWASTSGYFFGDKYSFSPGGWGMFFDQVYPSAVKTVVDLYETTIGKSQYKNLHQISRIMKALIFQRITDVYGDVPYFQAGEAYHKGVYFPAYDKQQDIYTDLLKEVSEAVDSLDDNGDMPVGDMYYSSSPGGPQLDEWRKFGNSLILRIAMRLTKVDPATAQSWVAKVQGKTMTSSDDNAICPHGTNDPLTINRIYRGIGEDGSIQLSGQMSQVFINYMQSRNDPRLSVYAYVYPPDFQPGDDPGGGSSDPDDQKGMPNGKDDGPSTQFGITKDPSYDPNPALGGLAQYSRPSPVLFNPTAPTLMLTYAQSEFLLADAAQRWGSPTDAETHYNNAVLGAMSELSAYGDGGSIDPGDAQDYLDANPYDPANGLQMINEQYWVETFFNEYEAWSNYRRTGFPVLNAITYPGSQSPGAVPRRMAYSTVDKQVNAANYNAAVSALSGGDKITSRMWWDTP